MGGGASATHDASTQWLFTRDDLAHTPSVVGTYATLPGASTSSKSTSQVMTVEQERILRGKGVHLIYKMGEFLQVGQHVMVTAATYFHRFFMRRPLQVSRASGGWSHYEMAATAMFLACKSEESLRKLPSIVDAVMASLDKSPEGQMRWAERSYRANHASHEYAKWRDCILLHEETLVTTLCFDFTVPQPHECLVRATRSLEVEPAVTKLAWTILNDCMRDPTCLFYDAPVLAAGAFLKACHTLKIDPAMYYAARPHHAPPVDKDEEDYFDWLDTFDVDDDEAREAMQAIEQDVYDFHMPLQQSRASSKPKVAADPDESVVADTTIPEPPPTSATEATASTPQATANAAERTRSASVSSRESGEIFS